MALIGAILAAFVAVRLPLLTRDASVRGWNGDTAIFGLMAKKICDGRGVDVFFWGQNYMGPLTPALAAAIRRTVLDPAGLGPEGGPISLRLASMSEIAFGICLYVLGLTRLFGPAIAAAAGLWMAIAPPYFIRLSVVPRGPEMSFALSSVLFFLAAGALARPRPFLERPFGHFVLGLLAGVGWWMNQTIVFVLLPVVVLVLVRSVPPRGLLRSHLGGEGGSSGERSSSSWRSWARFLLAVLGGVVLGYSPVWMGRLAGWYTPALGLVVPPWQPSGLLARVIRFPGTSAWQFIGLDGLAPPPLLAASALVLLSLVLFRRARRVASPLRTDGRSLEGLDLVGAIVVLGAPVFCLQNLDSSQARYLAPVLPAALALLLVSLAEAADLLRRRIPSGFVAAVSGGLALFLCVYLARRAHGVVEDLLREPDPRAPLRKIAEEGYTVCHAGYDTSYTLQFLSDGRVRFIPFHSPDRNRTLSAELRALPGPQCLVTDDGAVRRWLPSDASEEGGPARRRSGRR